MRIVVTINCPDALVDPDKVGGLARLAERVIRARTPHKGPPAKPISETQANEVGSVVVEMAAG
jgi:hypothetical protein